VLPQSASFFLDRVIVWRGRRGLLGTISGGLMKTSPIVRLLVMGVILVALNVPLTMMCGVVSERTARRNQVAAEVSEAGAARRQ
jgi:hypothetical protein